MEGRKQPANTSNLAPYWITKLQDILGALREFSVPELLIRQFFEVGQAVVIPGPLILNALGPIRAMFEEHLPQGDSGDGLSQLTSTIIQNTTQPFQVPPSMDGRKFHTLFTGSTIRLEIIGVICSLAGRSSSYGFGLAEHTEQQDSGNHKQYAQSMLAAADVISQVCKMLTPVNDLMVWLTYENLLLASIVHGDSSQSTWNRLGELSTDIFSIGAHRDPKGSGGLPTFLTETRRRLFAASYQLDKSIATFLGRPPRISWRHSDCRLPLDLADEDVVGSDDSIDRARSCLNTDGWRIDSTYQRASWIRMRFLVSGFREEILERCFQSPSPENATQFRDISYRCRSTWEALPAHLRYTPHCWDSDLPASVSLMLTISYLAYLFNEFLIQRLLVKQDPSANTALLKVSSTILSTVLALATRRGHVAHIHQDLTSTILVYGFPSASVLIKSLHTAFLTGQPFPFSGCRAELIRNVIVFISHLDLMVQPGNANYEVFHAARKMFSEIVDEILEAKFANTTTTIGASNLDVLVNAAVVDFANEPVGSVIDNASGDQLGLLETMDMGIMFDQWLV